MRRLNLRLHVLHTFAGVSFDIPLTNYISGESLINEVYNKNAI